MGTARVVGVELCRLVLFLVLRFVRSIIASFSPSYIIHEKGTPKFDIYYYLSNLPVFTLTTFNIQQKQKKTKDHSHKHKIMFNSFQNNTTQTTPPPPTITITTKMTNMNNRFGSKFDRMNSLRRQQHNDEDENSHPNIVTPANSNDVDDNNDYEDDNDVTTTATTTTTTTITPSSSPTDVRRFVEVPAQAALQLCDDIYAPLMPEEADDNQLAEFFTGLDVSPFLNDDDDNDNDNYNDQSDQHQQQFNNNTSISTIEQMDVVLCHGTKRRKLSHDEQAADSSVSLCSSSSASASAYTVDTYNDEDDETKFVLQRKQQLFVRE